MTLKWNKIVIYQFTIEAASPIHFGGSETGELIIDSEDKPILLGNSIGGALRAYLKEVGVSEETINLYMGGSDNNDFIESRIYVSDGCIHKYGEIKSKEGTAINSSRGSALENHKYALQYLEPGCIVTFKIECELRDVEFKSFNEMIVTLAKGFESGGFRLGGQQNNGFGVFKLNKLEKKVFELNSFEKLQEYIINPEGIQFEEINLDELMCHTIDKFNKLTFSMQGEFPYGVYQAFKGETHEITEIQKRGNIYYVPASSIKGLVKNEVRILLNRFMQAENAEKELNRIFGSQKAKGKVSFQDMLLQDAKSVGVKRFDKDGNPVEGHAVYIKIDRITGGAIDGKLKKQKEVCGEALLQCELTLGNKAEQQAENKFTIFLLIYALRRIGSGHVPIGGRTVTGLGEFKASHLSMKGTEEAKIPTTGELAQQEVLILKKYYDSFEGWCRSCQN